jgi:hypothetical protein
LIEQAKLSRLPVRRHHTRREADHAARIEASDACLIEVGARKNLQERGGVRRHEPSFIVLQMEGIPFG